VKKTKLSKNALVLVKIWSAIEKAESKLSKHQARLGKASKKMKLSKEGGLLVAEVREALKKKEDAKKNND
jgi:hypothetical protein